MKKMLLIYFLLIVGATTAWSQYLEIHQINVNNGDAIVIDYKDTDNTYRFKVLIDGGGSAAKDYLLPYLGKIFGSSNISFDYIILTHYHQDHYEGLLAMGTGQIMGKNYIDLGGYNTGGAPDDFKPLNSSRNWSVSQNYLKSLSNAASAYNLKRYQPMNQKTNEEKKSIDTVIDLGKYDGVDIQLRCVALWGYNLGKDGNIVNNGKSVAKLKKSPNNLSYAFVLECGEFRYFLGGDLGGAATTYYIDQETTLTDGFKTKYKGAQSFKDGVENTYDGHICGSKGDHHGSGYCNNSVFLTNMRPAVYVTSVGDKASWHLPSPLFMNRLDKTSPITGDLMPGENVFLQGFYFTNLQDFDCANCKDDCGKCKCLTTALRLFPNRAKTSFNYGDKGYVIKVKVDNSILTESKFEVLKVNKGTFKLEEMGWFYCHKKSL